MVFETLPGVGRAVLFAEIAAPPIGIFWARAGPGPGLPHSKGEADDAVHVLVFKSFDARLLHSPCRRDPDQGVPEEAAS